MGAISVGSFLYVAAEEAKKREPPKARPGPSVRPWVPPVPPDRKKVAGLSAVVIVGILLCDFLFSEGDDM
jgi:hypothetical protein